MLKFLVGYIFRKVLNGDNMTITLYSIPDDRIVVNKQADILHKLGDLTAHFKEDTNILNPVLEVAYNASYTSANYIYIPSLNRYYYITDIKTGMQRMYLTCEVDVLMSYKSSIKNMRCIVERQQNNFNVYLNDGIWRNLQARDVLTLNFEKNGHPTSFYRPCNFILTTGGEV